MYVTEFGAEAEFETYEEAAEALVETMETDDYIELLGYQIDFFRLINWAMKQQNFFEDFSDEISKAEEEFCNNYISYYEDEEEEEDE